MRLSRFLVPDQSGTVWGRLRPPGDDLYLIPDFTTDPVFPPFLLFLHRLSTIKGPRKDQGLILWWNRGISKHRDWFGGGQFVEEVQHFMS